ncbi:hypothetical protein [Kitasatospora aureofaciens]|uniref:hypothetical protein n=1 Tax=Kitasatospora aureofaciens TaxID=1894 RepID=UPI0038055D5F
MTDMKSGNAAAEAGAEFPHPVLAEIGGVTKTVTFARLADAMDAVRTNLAQLPLDDADAAHLAEYFAPHAHDRIARQLAEVGAVRTIAFVGIEAHVIYLRPAEEA